MECKESTYPFSCEEPVKCELDHGHIGAHEAYNGEDGIFRWGKDGATVGGSEEWPDSFWIVDFMKFNKEGRPMEGTSWQWSGIVFNARTALETAIDAMIDVKPEEASSWRCVRVTMDRQAVLAKKR